jgi:transposase
LHRWRTEAGQAGREIKRTVAAYEAAAMASGWRAGCEAYVIYPASVAVSREHRRAKTDRLDTELLMRAFVGLRGENPVVCRSRERDPVAGRQASIRPVELTCALSFAPP